MKSRSTCPACNVTLEFDRAVVSTVKCPKCGHQGNLDDFKEIPMQTVKCPHCRASMKVAQHTANMDFSCPKCKKNISPKSEDEAATALPTNMGNKDGNKMYRPGMLEMQTDEGHWKHAEKKVNLVRGVNTIGRKSPNSKSSIQLDSTDPYISKNHAKIDVVMTAEATFSHRLSDTGSTNGTFHNGDRLEPDDLIILMPGDTLKIGRTVFKFVTE